MSKNPEAKEQLAIHIIDSKTYSMAYGIPVIEGAQLVNYAIVYGYNTKALELLKKTCAQIMDRPPIAEYQVGCVISINTGPNMLGILYRT